MQENFIDKLINDITNETGTALTEAQRRQFVKVLTGELKKAEFTVEDLLELSNQGASNPVVNKVLSVILKKK